MRGAVARARVAGAPQSALALADLRRLVALDAPRRQEQLAPGGHLAAGACEGCWQARAPPRRVVRPAGAVPGWIAARSRCLPVRAGRAVGGNAGGAMGWIGRRTEVRCRYRKWASSAFSSAGRQ